jgi:hypothetical protein
MQVFLYLVHHLLDFLVRYRSFGASLANACRQLVSIELLPAPILLDHHEAVSMKSLVSSETGITVKALSPTPDAVVDAS